jgi:hypothetical protein
LEQIISCPIQAGTAQRLNQGDLDETHILPAALALAALLSTALLAQARKPVADKSSNARLRFAKASKSHNSPQTKWVAQSMKEMETIKVGMTRAQLLKVFTEEGDPSSRTWRRYVYRHCPLIKVDVDFRAVGDSPRSVTQWGADVITKILKPFLEWTIVD